MVQCLAALLAAVISRPRLPVLPPALPAELRQMISAAAPIAALSIVGILYQRLSLLLLPSLVGASAAGLFSAAARLVEAAKTGHIALFTAIFPILAQARSGPWSRVSKDFRRPWWILLSLAATAAFLLSSFALPLTRFLYGGAYLAAAPLLRVLSWMLIPYSVNGFLTLLFLSRGEMRSILLALGVAALTLAALTFVLVSVLGTYGATLSAVLAEVVQSLILIQQYYRRARASRAIVEPALGLHLEA